MHEEPSPEISDVQFLIMELALPRDGESPEFARVTKRPRDEDGNPVGRASDNLITDTRVFEVEYLDGHTTTMSANTIAECMFAQVDHEGGRLLLLDEKIDHRSNKDAVKQADAFINAPSGRTRRRHTTKGWELLMKWKDGSEAWVPLNDAKESFPVQVAKYAVQARIQEERAFCLVGTVCIEETVADCVEVEEQVLATNPKVWDSYTQDNQGGTQNK
jgi:hypothetical protein